MQVDVSAQGISPQRDEAVLVLNQEEISVVYQTKGVHNGKGNHRK